jgi:hypothetical protein
VSILLDMQKRARELYGVEWEHLDAEIQRAWITVTDIVLDGCLRACIAVREGISNPDEMSAVDACDRCIDYISALVDPMY